eukprot:1616474-Prymnesium_polylepis.1
MYWTSSCSIYKLCVCEYVTGNGRYVGQPPGTRVDVAIRERLGPLWPTLTGSQDRRRSAVERMEGLEALSRKELQAMAKAAGIRANTKSVELIDALRDAAAPSLDHLTDADGECSVALPPPPPAGEASGNCERAEPLALPADASSSEAGQPA